MSWSERSDAKHSGVQATPLASAGTNLGIRVAPAFAGGGHCAGILGEHRGSVARDVMITLEEWEEMKLLEEQAEADGTLFEEDGEDDVDDHDNDADGADDEVESDDDDVAVIEAVTSKGGEAESTL